jgi:hypothetical protein
MAEREPSVKKVSAALAYMLSPPGSMNWLLTWEKCPGLIESISNGH